jgi:hypothetical protein
LSFEAAMEAEAGSLLSTYALSNAARLQPPDRELREWLKTEARYLA